MIDLETRLRTDGAAWRRTVDQPSDDLAFTPPPTNRTRWMVLAAAALVVALAAIGTATFRHRTPQGSAAPGATGPSSSAVLTLPTAPASTDPLDPPTDAHPASLPPVVTVGELTGSGLVSLEWTYFGARGRDLTVRYDTGGGCTTHVGFHIIETDASVELISYGDGPTGTCAGRSGGFAYGTVQLAEPLGHRVLLHAPLGAARSENASPSATPWPADPTSTDPLIPRTGVASPNPRPIPTVNPTVGSVVQTAPWTFLRLADGGRTVVLEYDAGGGCIDPLGFRVIETSRSVELINFLQTAPSSTHRCGEDFKRTGYGFITLSQPLGDRELLHGP